MSFKVLIIAVLFLSGCTHLSSERAFVYTNTPTLMQQKLKKAGLPIEVIEANVQFISNSVRADNAIQLMYEINILNNYKIPLRLLKVEVYDALDELSPIKVFDARYLENNFHRAGGEGEEVNYLTGNQHATLNLTLDFENEQDISQYIIHKFYFERIKRGGSAIVHPVNLARIAVPEVTRISLGLPFKKKGLWLYETDAHRESRLLTEGRSSYAQRFAVDWSLVDANGFFASKDVKDNDDWYGYGVELLAVADGVVVDVKDGIVANEPLSENMAVRINRETIGGNYLVIDIGNDVVAFYGHLIANSLKVKAGDRVKKGQVIGLLGNSGSSSAPHLHFHLETRSGITMGGEGLPYHFKNIERLNTYSAEDVSSFFSKNKVDIGKNKAEKINEQFLIGYGLIKL